MSRTGSYILKEFKSKDYGFDFFATSLKHIQTNLKTDNPISLSHVYTCAIVDTVMCVGNLFSEADVEVCPALVRLLALLVQPVPVL